METFKQAFGYLFTEARKAVVAFVGGAISAGVPLALAALQVTSDGGTTITEAERSGIIGAALIGGVVLGLAVFGIKNVPQANP